MLEGSPISQGFSTKHTKFFEYPKPKVYKKNIKCISSQQKFLTGAWSDWTEFFSANSLKFLRFLGQIKNYNEIFKSHNISRIWYFYNFY